ncbi:MAG: MoxR family ATPase [Gammaproteobacteria bacterium]|nr:MoxR family ATPase [Gammaproteobacteria bacterium]
MSALGISATSARAFDDHAARLNKTVDAIGQIILGKEHAIRLALAAMVARGHVLIEDVPGVGKTTLAQVFARALGLDFQRIQFTSDLLPADLLGVSVFEKNTGEFQFRQGPVFTQLVLADEINRATPKTQSALLEAMEERQVTLDGETRALPAPFFVIATQNPSHQLGTFALPESQLDRFLIRLVLGYPDHSAERALLSGRDRRELLDAIEPTISPDQILSAQQIVPDVHTAEALLDYVQQLLRFTRESGDFRVGLSPRAGLGLLRVAQAWALLAGRDHVLPEDIQTVLPSTVGHRLQSARLGTEPAPEELVAQLIEHVPIP